MILSCLGALRGRQNVLLIVNHQRLMQEQRREDRRFHRLSRLAGENQRRRRRAFT